MEIRDCIFDDGESPLKESSDLKIYNTMFKWKYPLWYCRNVEVYDSSIFEMGRAGIWYTDNARFERCVVDAPKDFRRCKDLTLIDVTFTTAWETLWSCDNVTLKDVRVKGQYFGMNTDNINAAGIDIVGDYCFDGSRNVVITDSRLLSKDAFWNTENVTVKNTFISGEYLGWNAKNLTLENCTIESLQGMCYIDNLVMKNCKLINTTLAFEYSTVDATIDSSIDSVINPTSGSITADYIGELIMEKDKIDPSKTTIVCRK